MSFKIGVRVETEKGRGVVEFFGETEFAEGTWVGVNLDEPNGKHDGTVKGMRYFECEPNHGIFLKANQVRLESRGKSGMRLPSNIRKDVRSKISPASSPRMTPSSSTEKLKTVGGTGTSPKKLYSKEDTKGGTGRLGSQSPSQTTTEEISSSSHKSHTSEASHKLGGIPKKSSIVSKLGNVSGATNVEEMTTAESVKSIIKKMEESSLSAPLPPNMDERSELEWLRIQHKDLSEKLESLRIKRKEDHIKLVEFERNRIQLESLLQFRAKILEEQTSLQRKLQEKDKELRDALESKGSESDGLTEVEERLELITIEKEMAEEKVDILQTEIEAEKQRTQELEVELELLRNEMEQSSDSSFRCNSVQMKQLEQQNEKLREALVRMRDVTGQMVIDKQELTKENERLKDELASLTKMCEKIKKDSDAYENIIAELREQVDVAMGSEKMIEALTDRNLDMEEKVRALEETIDDFETMRAMDEEILETQKDAEKELREELDKACGRISELLLQIKACGAQAENYEKTILMFRKKVSDLNEEIQERYDENLRMLEQIQFLEKGGAVHGLQSTTFTATRAFSEMVDAEVRSLELEFAHQLTKYLKAFMPDNFTKPGGDDDAIILNVLFPRLYQKSVILAKLLSNKYPPVPGGMRREHVTKSHKAEQWAHCAKFNYLLNALECVLRKFESAIQRCSVERLSRLAQLQLEMATQERMIDQYIDLLKNDRLDENTSSANLEKGITYFQNVFSVHMAGEAYDMKQAFSDVISQLLSGLGWMKINVQRFTYFLLPGSEDSEIHVFAASLMGLITECEQLTIRSRNLIPAQKEMTINQQMDEQLSSVVNTLWKVATVASNICAVASIQLSTHTDAEGLQSDRIKEMLLGAVEKMNGQTDSAKAKEVIRNHMLTLKSILAKLAEQLDSGNLEVETSNKKPFPPLLERAHARKQDAVEAEGLRWQLEKKENEISDLKKTLRSRADDISNYRLRLEMADRKMETSGKVDESRVSILQSRCDELQNELKKRRDEYEETMDAIQRDLEACEKENVELKERAKNMSKKALLMNLSNTLTPSVTSLPSTPTATSGTAFTYASEIGFLEAALIEKQDALKLANEKIRHLKVQDMLRLLPDTGVSDISTEITGLLTLEAAQGPYKEELDKLIREAEGIISEARNYQVPYIANLHKQKKTQLLEKHQYYSGVRDVNYRIDDLKLKIHRFWSKYNPGKPLPSLFNNIKSIVTERPKYLQSGDRGVHSNAYKNAYSFLFDKLDVECKKFEPRPVLRK